MNLHRYVGIRATSVNQNHNKVEKNKSESESCNMEKSVEPYDPEFPKGRPTKICQTQEPQIF